MGKTVSMRLRCCGVLLACTILTAIALRIFQAVFIAGSLTSFGQGLALFLLVAIAIPLMGSGILMVILDPLNRVLKSIDAGTNVREDERRESRATVNRIPWILLAITAVDLISTSLITGFSIASGSSASSFTLPATLISCFAMILMASIQQVALIETILGEAKSRLDIRSIREHEHETMLAGRILLISGFSLIFATIFSGLAGYSFYIAVLDAPAAAASHRGIFFLELSLIWIGTIAWGFLLMRRVLISITNRIKRITGRIQDLTEGGTLDHRVDLIQFDEIGILGFRINRFIDSLSFVLASVREASVSVSNSASSLAEGAENAESALAMLKDAGDRVKSASTEQSTTTEKARVEIESVAESAKVVADQVSTQAGFVEQSSASIAEMAANIASVTRLTEKADGLSSQLKATSDSGEAAIRDTVTAIKSIDEASRSVAAIVKVIQKIAAQTNLLSMNAAIEAAHAGAAGAGFAVVADEVRTLAESSAKSAREIEALVQEMVSRIAGGVKLSDTAAEAFQRIASGVTDNSELIRTISASMDEQKIGADEILTSINSLVEATVRIKDLALDQRDRSERMKTAVVGISSASDRIEDAVQDENSSAEALEDVVALIRSETEKNRLSVGALETAVERFK